MKAFRIKAITEKGEDALKRWLDWDKEGSLSQRFAKRRAKGFAKYTLEVVSQKPLVVDYSDKFISIMGKQEATKRAHQESVLRVLCTSEFSGAYSDFEIEAI